MPCESAAASCAEPRRHIRQGGDRDPGSERGETAACEDPWHERSGERDGSFGCGPRSGWERDGALPGDGGERARSASEPGDEKAKLPPGPNNPVGVVWIDLSKPHYGIHGSREPSTIGGSTSHGCIRLTNWDALELGHLVSPGTPAVLEK